MGNRGRRKGANGEQSRKLLLEIAADEFANMGYHETKISTIVQRAELTQPTFYLYFKSKEEIFRELVEKFRTELMEFVRRSRLEPGLSIPYFPEKIKKGITAILQFFAENPNLARIGLFIAPEVEEIKKQLADKIAENLVAEQQEGYFRQDIDMDFVADSLIGIIERQTATKLLNGVKGPDMLASEIVDLVLFGLHTSISENG